MKSIISAFILGSATAFAGPAENSSVFYPAPAPDWSFNMALYAWAQGLDGDVGILGHTAAVDVGFKDILSNLDIAAMGAFEVSRGRWGFITDLVYADISDSGTGGLGIKADVDVRQFLGNFVASYEVAETDLLRFDVYAGARVNWINTDLKLTGPRGRTDLNASDDQAWVDPVIGARFRAELPHNFFLTTLGDVGGFDLSSQFTWQAMGGIGYKLNANSSLLLGYRAIGTDYTNSGFTYDITGSGLMLAFDYRF